MSVQLWAISADFLVLWVLFLRYSYAGASLPYFVPDTIYSPLFSMHGLDKVAHVSHVPGPLAPPPLEALDCLLSPQSTAIWPSLRRLVTGLSAFGIGRQAAFPAVDGYLARLTWRLTAAGGDASAAWLRLLSLSLLFGPEFGFCRTTVQVVLTRSPGCPSRQEPARSQGFPIPADNFPNEVARVCDSAGKSPAWRCLEAAFSFSLR